MKAKISTLIKSPSFIVASVAIILGIIYTFSGLFNPVIKTSGPYGPLAWNSKDYGPATFTQASIYCHDLGDNWRVPTMDELNYAIKGHYIPFVSPNFYWSSTQDEHVDYKYNAYTMNA